MTTLKGKTVLVTGATGGFGSHMTGQFLARGCSLVLTDLDAQRLADLAERQGDAGRRILASIPADLSTAQGCKDLAAECMSAGLLPDVLVNNAGIGLWGRHDHVPPTRWEALMQINLLSPMRLCGLFLPHMIERGSGHIVNISSLAGWVGAPGLSAYNASKFGLRGFGEALSADTEAFGIIISGVYPSFSRTPILDSEQFGVDERKVVPEHMISDPADIVAAIVRGIERDSLHIFPDPTSRRVHYVSRFFPWVIPVLNRRLAKQAT